MAWGSSRRVGLMDATLDRRGRVTSKLAQRRLRVLLDRTELKYGASKRIFDWLTADAANIGTA